MTEVDALDLCERRQNLLPTHQDEPLVEVGTGSISALGSYRRGGWQHGVPRQWVRQGVGRRLGRVSASLPRGYGLAVFDAWRPLELQQELFNAGPHEFRNGAAAVAPPSDDALRPPPHLTGGAIDLTLTRHGEPLMLGTGFDEFTGNTPTLAFEQRPGAIRDLRRLLYHSMHGHGFVVLHEEWWHFEYGTRLWSALTNHPVAYGATHPDQRLRRPTRNADEAERCGAPERPGARDDR
jgi:zinc D-Ala-D-Ala dipeptidase